MAKLNPPTYGLFSSFGRSPTARGSTGGIVNYAPSVAGTPTASSSPGAGPFSTLANTKSGAIQGQLDSGLGDYGANKSDNATDLSSFADLFKAQTPDAQNYLNQENNAVSNFYNGTTKNDLQNLANQRNMALRGVANLALQNAHRQASNEGLLAGIAGSSYQNAQAMANASDIFTKAALDHANQQQQNYQYLNQNQLGLQGMRGSALNNFAQRSMMPYNLRNQNLATEQNQLAGYNALDKSNNFYGLSKPQNPRAYGLAYANGAQYGAPTPSTNSFYNDTSAYGLNYA